MNLFQFQSSIFNFCQHKTEESKNIEVFTSIYLKSDVLVWNRNAFPQSRMATFETYDKMDNLDQKCSHMTLSEPTN